MAGQQHSEWTCEWCFNSVKVLVFGTELNAQTTLFNILPPQEWNINEIWLKGYRVTPAYGHVYTISSPRESTAQAS